jgi:hypothetical protein
MVAVRPSCEHVFVPGRWTAERDRDVRKRYDAGESANGIARSLRADKRTVRDSLLRTGSVRTYPETRARASALFGHEAAVIAARGRGVSLQAIADEYGVSIRAVNTCLERAGFAVALDEIVRRRARARSPGASYFQSICDEPRAYWLGFITADGWLARHTRSMRFGVNLAERDAEHLAILADHLDLPFCASRKKQVLIRSNNSALAHDLQRAGITERKSSDNAIVLTLVRTPPALRRHFIRGLFDGDGSAFDTTNGVRVLEFS